MASVQVVQWLVYSLLNNVAQERQVQWSQARTLSCKTMDFTFDCRPTPEPEVVESIQVPVQETAPETEEVQGASADVADESQGRYPVLPHHFLFQG